MNLPPTGLIHLPLYRQPSRWKPAPLQVWGTHTQLNRRLPNTRKLSNNKDKLVRTKTRTRVSKKTLEQRGPQLNEGEMKISFGEVVDQGLLLRFPKDQGLWVVD